MDYPFAVVAVDVGGTKIACGAVRYDAADAAPCVLLKRSVPTQAAEGGQAVLARIVTLVGEVLGDAAAQGLQVAGIGVGTAGRVDVATGAIAYANDIMPGWTGQPVKARLQEAYGLPVAVLGDVQSHALGEARWGAARGAQTCVVLAPGTGLGGSVVAQGRIVLGAHGFAGEVGATMNPLDAADGTLESVASGSGIEARYLALTGQAASGAEISQRAQAGEAAACEVITNAGRALGLALADLVSVFDPEVAVLSGSVTKAGALWRDALDEAFAQRTIGVQAGLAIAYAALADDAPLIGAAEYLLDSLKA